MSGGVRPSFFEPHSENVLPWVFQSTGPHLAWSEYGNDLVIYYNIYPKLLSNMLSEQEHPSRPNSWELKTSKSQSI